MKTRKQRKAKAKSPERLSRRRKEDRRRQAKKEEIEDAERRRKEAEEKELEGLPEIERMARKMGIRLA